MFNLYNSALKRDTSVGAIMANNGQIAANPPINALSSLSHKITNFFLRSKQRTNIKCMEISIPLRNPFL